MIDWILHRSRLTQRLMSAATVAMVVLSLVAVAAPATTVQAGPVADLAGFEGHDGNLVDDPAGGPIDWNSFAPVTWTGTAPFRQADKTALGWRFKGIEDAQDTTSDSAFAGGTKQDDNCANVVGAKAPNKDDLERIYAAIRSDAAGNAFLALAWVRITQNTTSASAHVGFEFNSSETPCPGTAGTAGLVQRTAGDLLIVYDFEGGAGDAPRLTVRKWVTSGPCEVGNSSPPCWGLATDLTASGFAEAKVNTAPPGGPGPVSDAIAPPPDVPQTLGLNEFGEAVINLTGAGVIPANACVTFGKLSAVSRSSGNSAQAQMKDLVGPGDFKIQNCGTVTVIKHTSPGGLNQDFGYTSTLPAPAPTNTVSCTLNTTPQPTPDTTPASFTLNDATTDTFTCVNVPVGSYTVTEGADPVGFLFADLSCTATGAGTSATPASGNATRTASITIAGGGTATCTYTNNQQLGAIKITQGVQ